MILRIKPDMENLKMNIEIEFKSKEELKDFWPKFADIVAPIQSLEEKANADN